MTVAITKVGDTDIVQRGILISKYVDGKCNPRGKAQAEFLIDNDDWCNTVYVKQMIAKCRLEEYFS